MLRLTLVSFWVLIVSLPSFGQDTSNGNTFQHFYQRLNAIPHESLTSDKGIITFTWDEKKYRGYEITFVTNDSLTNNPPSFKLPLFWPKKDTTLYNNGWRYNLNYDAGGPGSTIYGIEKADTLCLISESQPASLVERGKIVSSSTLTIEIQCRVK